MPIDENVVELYLWVQPTVLDNIFYIVLFTKWTFPSYCSPWDSRIAHIPHKRPSNRANQQHVTSNMQVTWATSTYILAFYCIPYPRSYCIHRWRLLPLCMHPRGSWAHRIPRNVRHMPFTCHSHACVWTALCVNYMRVKSDVAAAGFAHINLPSRPGACSRIAWWLWDLNLSSSRPCAITPLSLLDNRRPSRLHSD